MRAVKRLALGCAVLAFAAVAFSGVASAQVKENALAPDMQSTNVPYLAWNGEQILLTKCADVIAPDSGQSADFIVEDWSGDSTLSVNKPSLEPGTVRFYTTDDGDHCVSADFASLKPGLAIIKLVVSDSTGPLLKHQFLAGWMTLQKPSLTISSTDFTAGGKNGLLDAYVKGTLPMGQDFTDLGLPSSLTMPDDWASLAGALATSNDPDINDAGASTLWDIHDDQAKSTGHVPNSAVCGPPPSLTGIDAVDNCFGGDGADGAYSTIYGPTDPELFVGGPHTGGAFDDTNTVGPFDPLRQDQTLLSDGKVDSGDAPMPAARLDFAIAQNSGSPTDISGVGSLEAQSKDVSYSRDGTGADTKNNLYAPFYWSYIPATAVESNVGNGTEQAVSGIDGPAGGNNFVGFLVNGEYHFWDVAWNLGFNTGGDTNCLHRTDQDPSMRQLPSGDFKDVVYTDEHGEAQMQYDPGTGAFFDNLAGIKNDNGGCDLQGIDVIGTADITATARYPYQPVTARDQASDPVSVKVHSLFDKSLSYVPKGAGSANNNARIVIAHAQDITGAPEVGEVVCFAHDSNAENQFIFVGTVHLPPTFTNTLTINDTPTADPTGSKGFDCALTDANGNAAVEVFNSNGTMVNEIAYFYNQQILRDIHVDFGTAGSSSGTPGGPATVSSPSQTTGTAAPTASQLNNIAAVGTASKVNKAKLPALHKKTKRQFKLVAARYIHPTKGARYLVVRVNGPAGKTAKIQIRLLGKNRHLLRTVTRTVPTNYTVQLRNLHLTSKVAHLKVRLS
jgi:hypothetical protein